jgi:hypothetical protein
VAFPIVLFGFLIVCFSFLPFKTKKTRRKPEENQKNPKEKKTAAPPLGFPPPRQMWTEAR